MRGGIENFRNLFLFLSDTYLGSEFGHEAPGTGALGGNLSSLTPGPSKILGDAGS